MVGLRNTATQLSGGWMLPMMLFPRTPGSSGNEFLDITAVLCTGLFNIKSDRVRYLPPRCYDYE